VALVSVFFFRRPVVLVVSIVAVVVALAVGPAEADILVRCPDSTVAKDRDTVILDALGSGLVQGLGLEADEEED
jgi:hypothetical protein